MLIDTLYKNYKSKSRTEILSYLDKIKLVMLTHNGIGSLYGYYEISSDLLEKIKKSQRSYAFTHDWVCGEFIEEGANFEVYKELMFLCKSTSPMMVKPDIGEVFDQMSEEDIRETKAIDITVEVNRTFSLEDPSHHLCYVRLLK